MPDLIEPRVLKGFRDMLPPQEIERAELIERLQRVFRSYGYVPIDTPALEYADILLSKEGGETEKQVYRFEDNGGRDVALRYDLTVPLARFMAEHRSELYLPFRRYHVAKAWRGEKNQKGRYREFIQCDFDMIGSDSLAGDLEILLVMRSSLAALGVERCTVRFSHRGAFNELLARAGVGGKSVEVLRAVDKLAKIGEAETRALLAEACGTDAAAAVMDFIMPGASSAETLERMEGLSGGPSPSTARLRGILAGLESLGVADGFVLDPSITRGLDYYTGIVYETFLDELPGIGSVCSGGRYDDLVSKFSKERMSGVGSSIGIDRLLAGLEELGLAGKRESYSDALVACPSEEAAAECHAAAAAIRAAGLACEVYPDARKLPQQFAYAERKGIRYAVVPGGRDKPLIVRNIARRENREAAGAAEVAAIIREGW